MYSKPYLIFSSLVLFISLSQGSDRRTKYGCEGTTLDIECEEGTVINLVRANFGRFSISICNDGGNTTWSTNCIQPTTLRVLKKRCGAKQRCRIPVNSDLFGNPCPDTHKYVEVHYTCEPKVTQATTIHAIPPWLLDLSATPAPTKQTTTTTTTQKPTTTTQTTTTTTTTTTSSPTKTTAFAKIENDDADTEDVENERDYDADISETKNELLVLESLMDHCPPVTTRNLFWNWTRSGDLAIQPCPGGSSGFAKWRCSSDAGWYTGSPDLSECQSHWLTRLETKLRKGGSVISVSSELSGLTEIKTLYGGDLSMITQLLQSLAHKARQDLFSIANQEEKEMTASQLGENTLKVGSNLLEDNQMLAWSDLEPVERAQVGSNLVLAIQENTFFQADTINIEKNIVMMEENLLSSVRIMRARDLYDQEFLSRHGNVRIIIPAESLIENSENGAVRLVFFHYNNLDHVLPSSTNGIQFLNSHIASASLSKGHATLLSHPLTASFTHLESEGMANPSCVWWDYVSRTWTEQGCWVQTTNSTQTTCQCNHLGNMAVLMEEAMYAAPHSIQNNPSTITVVIAAIVSIVICVVTVTATFIIFRRFSKGMCKSKIPCLESREPTPGYYPYLSSSATSTTITATTPDKNNSSQYFLNNECQVLRPLMITPIGPNSTIYRATFANGQQAHVIPIEQSNEVNKYQFRPITPSASHIYMEIDPVYNSETMSDILVSDISDDDLRRSCDDTNLGNDKTGIARIQNQSSNNSMNALHSNRCNTTERCDSSEFNPRIVADPPISGTFSSGIQRQPSWPWTNSNNGHLVQPTMASLHSNVNTVFQ